jgi:myo-inositol 2-dehydrogenase / D-chiro-inositol 1-dehydrogenase
MARATGGERPGEHRPAARHARPPGPEVRLGLIGCGRLAERGWLAALERVDGARLVAVADPDPGRREAPRAERRYERGQDLIAHGGLDAVIVATPADVHLEDARRAAAAGLPSLVEKPPAPDLAGASALARLEPLPWIGFNRRFDPAVGALRDMVPPVGPVGLDLRLHYRRASWSPHVVRDDALLDLGPHLIDLALWLAGAPAARVRAARLDSARARIELEFAGGRGAARLDCATDRHYREHFEVRGEGRERHGQVVRGGALAALRGLLRPPDEHPLVASLARQLESLVGALRGSLDGRLATARDGVAVMAAIEAARRSAARGSFEEVRLEPVQEEAARC